MSKYTVEQEKIVKAIISQKGDYYRILSVEKSSTDVEIKKAYRKLALKVHPDKNTHPNAQEAFKIVCRAFEVLSDSTKKRIYDQTGTDPDERMAGAGPSSSPFASAGGRSPFGNGSQFHFTGSNSEFDEHIFNLFFGPGFLTRGTTFSFGNSGFSQFGGSPRRRSANSSGNGSNTRNPNNQSSETSAFFQFLPVIVLILFSLFTSRMTDTQDNTPQYSFYKQGKFQIERHTPSFNVPYFVSEEKVAKANLQEMTKLDKSVESRYIHDLKYKCNLEQNERDEVIKSAYGFFYTDQEKLQEGQEYPTPSCDRLKSYGFLNF